jgi:hypothetical protein
MRGVPARVRLDEDRHPHDPVLADAAVKITDFKAGLLASSDPGPPVGEQKLTLTTVSAQVCVTASTKLNAVLTVTKEPGSHAAQRLQDVSFTIDTGLRHVRRKTVSHGGRRRTVTVTVYLPNATFRTLPAAARLALKGLKRGNQALTVVATYSSRTGSGSHRHLHSRAGRSASASISADRQSDLPQGSANKPPSFASRRVCREHRRHDRPQSEQR